MVSGKVDTTGYVKLGDLPTGWNGYNTAIISVSCRLNGSTDVYAFYENIVVIKLTSDAVYANVKTMSLVRLYMFRY